MLRTKRKRATWPLCLSLAAVLLAVMGPVIYVGLHLLAVDVWMTAPLEWDRWRLAAVPHVFGAFTDNRDREAHVFGVQVDLGFVHAIVNARWPEELDPEKHDDIGTDDTSEREWDDWWKELGEWWRQRRSH